MMDSSSNSDHHLHQDNLHGSSSLSSLPPLPPFHDCNQTFILNNGGFIPTNNGARALGFEPPLPPLTTTSMVQELGLIQWSSSNATNYMNQSAENQIKDDQFSSGSSITDNHFPMALSGISSPFDVSTSACSRGNFSMVLPTTNISSQNQLPVPLFPISLGMDLQAFDAKYGSSFSQCSSNNHSTMPLFKQQLLPSHGLEHLQEQNQVLSNGYHNKMSSLVPGATEAPQTVTKKQRLEQRSSFSPFKVRKEKLGDRIAALQQLVAPFGKTDTASVLMEAIGYIKFLQDQVETLSVPYMRSSGNNKSRPMPGGVPISSVEDKEENKPDLRSRGLCLVPLACTSYVTNENGGLWSPPNFRAEASLRSLPSFSWRSIAYSWGFYPSRCSVPFRWDLRRRRHSMVALHGPVIYPPTAHLKLAGNAAPFFNAPIMKTRMLRSVFFGTKGRCGDVGRGGVGAFFPQPKGKRRVTVYCTFSSSSNDNGSTAGNFRENDEDYVNSSVIEAVEVRSGSDGFSIKMRDGRNLKCVHNNPQGGHLPDYAPHPAIVLKMEDGSDLLLPIIVLEMPSVMLMAAMRNVPIARPTVYQVLGEMIEKMGYEVQLVRVTKRVHEAYFAQLYLTKVGNEKDCISFDLRPSDAINVAVRSKVPIQVNKQLAYSDGMRVVEPVQQMVQVALSDGFLFTELDRPDGQPCIEAKEFDLIRNMLIAAVEERYRDAAQWRDKLSQLRAKRKNWA
ncbi:hypothetical protein J5N97_007408 [Dioscorea zingiberensis]|uniref:Uncharacterized protein n=1 Tax=Dioscorea zingiberensis TaxID=325984 RepID=A0A9D5DEZ3_9LILI|nr:hypothetical protein J5N97_007408 [Dioscorea zingiberensis]